MKNDYRNYRIMMLISIILHSASAFFIGMGLYDLYTHDYKHLGLYGIAIIVFIITGAIDRGCSKFLNERD